jgi:hypothetical protein
MAMPFLQKYLSYFPTLKRPGNKQQQLSNLEKNFYLIYPAMSMPMSGCLASWNKGRTAAFGPRSGKKIGPMCDYNHEL